MKNKITTQIILYIAGTIVFLLIPKTAWPKSSIVYFIASLLFANTSLNLLLKDKTKSLILSSIIAPLFFCLVFHLNNLNDFRILKYLPLIYVYMFIYMLPLLIPINYSINEIINLCRRKI